MPIDGADVTIQHRILMGPGGEVLDVMLSAFGTITMGDTTVSFRDGQVKRLPRRLDEVEPGDKMELEVTLLRPEPVLRPELRCQA
jgi:hypothetical protein